MSSRYRKPIVRILVLTLGILTITLIGLGIWAYRVVEDRAKLEKQFSRLMHAILAETHDLPVQEASAEVFQQILSGGVSDKREVVCRDAQGFPIDPWGNRFDVALVKEDGEYWIRITSKGPDGLADTEDDDFWMHPYPGPTSKESGPEKPSNPLGGSTD